MRKYTKVDENAVIDYYKELLKYFSEITDDELTQKFQELDSNERAIICLYIAADYKIGIVARLLRTNCKYAKHLITNIQNKMKS